MSHHGSAARCFEVLRTGILRFALNDNEIIGGWVGLGTWYAPLSFSLHMPVRSSWGAEIMSFNDKPFRFGVQITCARTGDEWREQARRAEALGYDVFLMADHFGNQFSIGPTLASVAEVTSTIRIGLLEKGRAHLLRCRLCGQGIKRRRLDVLNVRTAYRNAGRCHPAVRRCTAKPEGVNECQKLLVGKTALDFGECVPNLY